MITKRTEYIWDMHNEDKELIAWIEISNGELSATIKELDTLQDYKEFHQALGEAIAIAEAQE